MLKSNYFNSIIDDLSAFGDNTFEALHPNTLELESTTAEAATEANAIETTAKEQNQQPNNSAGNDTSTNKLPATAQTESSLVALQLTAGLMKSFTPPIAKARNQLKELIGKQNKIYIDLSTEKYKLDNSEVATLQEMMTDVKVYREKLNKIKKQMQNIYQRTKGLKKRAVHIQTCKEKEHQRKVQKQQLEESLIGKQ